MDGFSLDSIRYGLSIILVLILPIVCAFWFVIHGAIGFWKSRPTWMAYWAALVVIVITIATSLQYLPLLLGTDLGRQPVLFTVGALIYLTSWALSRNIRRHLNFRTFAGVPEIKGEASALIQSGPFSVVRHPRYFMILIGVLGWSLAANYSGAYLISVAFAAALLLIVRFEERELVSRFGDAYRTYQANVPALLPSPKNIGRLFV
ncbi:MAG: isoprenylcysteine carboxylmethyltransferase family protein [Pseudomonadota bacterium]